MNLSTMTPSVAVGITTLAHAGASARSLKMLNMSDDGSLEQQQPSPMHDSDSGVTEETKSRLDELEERSRSNRKITLSMTDEEAKQVPLVDLIERKEWKFVMNKMAEKKSEEASVKQTLTLEGHETKGYPLHLALSKKPPIHVVQGLIDAYPDAVKSPEDKWGRLPLHIACIFTASAQVLQALLTAYKESLQIPDQAEGRLPVHYACLHGSPFEIAVLVDTEPYALIYQDSKLKTPLDLAQESSNPHREAILERLEGKTHIITEELRLRRKNETVELELRDASSEIVGEKRRKSGRRRSGEMLRNKSKSSNSMSTKSLTSGAGSRRNSRRSISTPKERPSPSGRLSPASASLDGSRSTATATASRVKEWKPDFEKSVNLSAAFLVKSDAGTGTAATHNNSNSIKTFRTPNADVWDLDRSGRGTASSSSEVDRSGGRKSITSEFSGGGSLSMKDLSALVLKMEESGDFGAGSSGSLGASGVVTGTGTGTAHRKSKKKSSGKIAKKHKKDKKEKKEKKSSSSAGNTPTITSSKYAAQQKHAQALTKGIPKAAAATGMTSTTSPIKNTMASRPKKQRRSLTTDDLERLERSTAPRRASSSSGIRRSKPRGLGNYLESSKRKQEKEQKSPQEADLKSMSALSLPANLFSQPLLEEAFEESESHLDNEDGFIFQETLQMMLSSTAPGSTMDGTERSSMLSPGSSRETQQRSINPEMIKLEAQIRNLDVRKEALTQETTNIENNVRRKRSEAQSSRERIASLQAKLVDTQLKLEKEKRTLELTMMNIQVQEETLTDHRTKIESVDNEREQLATKKEQQLGERDDVRSRKQ